MSLYGLKQAPRNWYMFMVDVMSKCDMKKSTYDGCIFYRARKSLRTIAGIHVDDLLMIFNDEEQVGLIKRVFEKAFGVLDWKQDEFDFLSMHFCVQPDFSITVDNAA